VKVGASLTPSQTINAPTDALTSRSPHTHRVRPYLAPTVRQGGATAAPYTVALDALKHASRSSSLQATSRPLFYEPRVCVCDAPRGLGMRGEGERGDAGGWRAGGSLGRHTVRGAEGYTTSAGGRMRTDS